MSAAPLVRGSDAPYMTPEMMASADKKPTTHGADLHDRDDGHGPDLPGNHRVERITTFGYLSPTDGTCIGGDLDQAIRRRSPSSENEVPTNTCSIRVTSQHKRLH